jgi:hypothetical protein
VKTQVKFGGNFPIFAGGMACCFFFGFFFHTISGVTFTKDIGLYSFNIFGREIVEGSFDFKSLKIRNIRKTFLEINEPISDRRYLFPGYLKLIVRHPVTFI